MTTSAASVETTRSLPVAPPMESGLVASQDENWSGGSGGGKSPRVVEQMAVEPAGSRSAAGGRFGVCLLGGRGGAPWPHPRASR
jgi:hypothetical protein